MSNTDSPLTIREATASDVECIVRFNQLLARETEDKQLDPARLRAGVEQGLARPDACRYYLAEQNGRVIGQTMVTCEWSDWRNGLFWWIQSVYVDHGHRRGGVFRALFRHVEAAAKRSPDVCGLRLYVDQTNDRAISTYRRLGMKGTEYVVYEVDWSGLGFGASHGSTGIRDPRR